jgi:hypothetical protein
MPICGIEIRRMLSSVNTISSVRLRSSHDGPRVPKNQETRLHCETQLVRVRKAYPLAKHQHEPRQVETNCPRKATRIDCQHRHSACLDLDQADPTASPRNGTRAMQACQIRVVALREPPGEECQFQEACAIGTIARMKPCVVEYGRRREYSFLLSQKA